MTRGERGNSLKRQLDRWVGCPLIYTLGIFHKPRPCPTNVQKVGVLMFGAIGDALLSSSIIHDLKRTYPAATITAFVSAANSGIFDLIEGPDAVVTLPLTRPVNAILILRNCRFDILIDTAQWPRISAILAALSAARFTIGFNTSGQFRHLAFDAAAPHSAQCHEIENFRNLLGCLGLTGSVLPRFKRSLFVQAGAEHHPHYIVLHPWASGYKSHLREWPTDNWIRLAEVAVNLGFRVMITGGPHDRERSRSLAAEMAHQSEIDVIAGRASLADTAVALINARAVISVNTGIMHIAALLGTPTIGLHGPTNPHRWGPIGSNCIVVGPGREHGCAYLNLGFEYPKNAPDCMSTITVDEVVAHVSKLLGRPH